MSHCVEYIDMIKGNAVESQLKHSVIIKTIKAHLYHQHNNNISHLYLHIKALKFALTGT